MGIFLEVSCASYCIHNCVYCPQKYLKDNYSLQFLTLENFKKVVDKIPANSTITFSGYSEPCSNNEIVDIILYATDNGHDVQICTTLIGLNIGKYKKIKDLKWKHFGIHLPDDENKSTFPVTKRYAQLLQYIVDNPPENLVFSHHAGEIRADIVDIVKDSIRLNIHNRSGNLEIGETRECPNVIKCGHQFLFTHEDGSCVLNFDGNCYICCQDFKLQYKLGNLFEQDWIEIRDNIKITELCKRCICGVE